MCFRSQWCGGLQLKPRLATSGSGTRQQLGTIFTCEGVPSGVQLAQSTWLSLEAIAGRLILQKQEGRIDVT